MFKRLVALAGLLAAGSLHAATFFVPEDRAEVRGAEAIVVAGALESHTILTEGDAIRTVTTMSIEEVIKGSFDGHTFEVVEPGGVYGHRGTFIPGIPRFRDGERSLLFLVKTPAGWSVRNIDLGKFSFATDRMGRKLLVRDEGEIVGWDSKGGPHEERRRSAEEFLQFVRTEAAGGMGKSNYFVTREPFDIDIDIDGENATAGGGTAAEIKLKPKTLFTPQSYTFTNARWNVFPSAVTFFSVGTEPGAPGNGVTAINAAFAAWNGDASSNVNYVYGGQDVSGSHTGGIATADGQNTIAFERNLTAYGIQPLTCSQNSWSGVLGAAGIPGKSGTHAGPGGTWDTTTEADVEMNQGIANCTKMFNDGDFNTAVTHEVGHTLSFKHADQAPGDFGHPCNSATEECSTNAVMKAFITLGINATLQAYDQHAVAAVYPSGPPPGIPTGVVATATSTSAVTIQWNGVTSATSYEIYRRAPGGSFGLLNTTAAIPFNDTTVAASTSYLYRVRAVNAGGSSGDSSSDLATTVIFTADPLPAGSTLIAATHLTQLRTAVDAVRSLAGQSAGSYMDASLAGVVVKAVHINDLRTALDAARGALGFSTGGYTDALSSGVVVKAVHTQELRNRVK